MSDDELLDRARTLPREEHLRLVHALIDAVARPDLPSDEIVQRALALDFAHNPPNGLVEALHQLLEDQKNGKLSG